MFKAVVSTKEDGTLYTTEPHKTARAAITDAANTAETADGQQVRIAVRENNGLGNYLEVFWAWGGSIENAAVQAKEMDRKSRVGGSR